MVYAIISDVHGNAQALRAVLEDARQHGADRFIYAGDYCISAPWPNEVIQMIRSSHYECVVRGNGERHFRCTEGNDGQMEISRWCAKALRPEYARWMDTVPEQLGFEMEGVHIHLAHSSECFLGDVELKHFSSRMIPERYPNGPVSRKTLLADIRGTLQQDEKLKKRLAGMRKGVYIFGHTHVQWHVEMEGCLLINPGSCGLPLDNCSEFGAPYTLLKVKNGKMSVEERRVPYDIEKLIRDVKETEQYREARVWCELIFEEWRSGKEKVFYFLQHAEAYAQSIGDDRRPFAKDTWETAYKLWCEQNNQ